MTRTDGWEDARDHLAALPAQWRETAVRQVLSRTPTTEFEHGQWEYCRWLDRNTTWASVAKSNSR